MKTEQKVIYVELLPPDFSDETWKGRDTSRVTALVHEIDVIESYLKQGWLIRKMDKISQTDQRWDKYVVLFQRQVKVREAPTG